MIRPQVKDLVSCKKITRLSLMCDDFKLTYSNARDEVKQYNLKGTYYRIINNRQVIHKVQSLLGMITRKKNSKVLNGYVCIICDKYRPLSKYNLTTFHYEDHCICLRCEV